MEAVDVDGDGTVTKEEWVENAMKSHYIASMLGQPAEEHEEDD